MDRRLRLDCFDGLELEMLVAELLEHPRAASEQHRDEVNRELVDQSRFDVLAPGLRAAHHGHILVAGCRSGLLERGLDPADEGVHASLGHIVWRAVGHHEDRYTGLAGGPVRAPPRQRVVVGAPASDHRAGAGDPVGEHRAVALILTERPLDELQAPVAHRLLWALVRGGHEAIEGHADVEENLAHFASRLVDGQSYGSAQSFPRDSP
jgi:hypothetical protein